VKDKNVDTAVSMGQALKQRYLRLRGLRLSIRALFANIQGLFSSK
jgi:hypothetical protein